MADKGGGKERLQRRLAAVLAADMVGYSRLMANDESGTLARLNALRRDVIAPVVAENHGRIVKLMGDGILAEFASVVDAVTAAVAWQDRVSENDALQDGAGQILFRIGINLGDVIVEADDLYGEGVNIAARLEALAPPGGLCISEDAWRQVRGKLDLDWHDMGLQHLKNLAEPLRAFSLTPSETTAAEIKESLRPSLAVLPFVNLSGDPEQEYFSDGVTEDLIAELSRFRDLKVISRSSSFAFKGQNLSAAQAAQALGADYIVEGSIRKAGKRVRIAAQLIEAKGDSHIWAERYDRDMADIFEIQDDVVRRVAGTLVGRLEQARWEGSMRRSERELEAYDLYLRAREHFVAWSPADNRKAAALLETAIATEPQNAAVLALLSEVRLRTWINGWSDEEANDLEEALELANRALRCDENDSRTHTALAMACLFTGAPDKARHHFETALRLNPNDTRVLVYSSRHAVFHSDPQRAVELARQALERNPYGKFDWYLGIASFVDRRYDEAVRYLRNIRDPNAVVLALLAGALAMTGRDAEAKEAATAFLARGDEIPVMKSLRHQEDWRAFFTARWPFRDPDESAHLLTALRRAGIPV